MKELLAEGLGTFLVVFLGTGAMIVDVSTGGGVTHAGVALAFGLAVSAAILLVRHRSGAHLNPAVTIGLVAAERFPAGRVLPYATAQCSGAIAASIVLEVLFPGRAACGTTHPAGSIIQSFGLEAAMTFLLVLVILRISADSRRSGWTVAAVVGAVVGLEALLGGPISGASMNPARSLAPAVVSGKLDSLWIYGAAPILGAGLAVPACRWMKARGCCEGCGEVRPS